LLVPFLEWGLPRSWAVVRVVLLAEICLQLRINHYDLAYC
jgi:hypothetical protein